MLILLGVGASLGTSSLGAAPDSHVPGVLVSRQALQRARLKVGDVVTLAADASGAGGQRFRIDGVYEPTPDPMKFNVERLEVRLHLDDLLRITGDPGEPNARETVTAINLALLDPADGSGVADRITRRNPLLIVTSTSRGDESGPFAVLERFHVAVATVTVVGSTAFLLALMVIRAEERRETIGVLRLIGISSRSILLEVVVEGMLVAVAGALFGILLAAAAQYGVNRFFQARYDTALVFVKVTPSIALRSVVVAAPVGIVAGVVASWAVLRRGTAALVRR